MYEYIHCFGSVSLWDGLKNDISPNYGKCHTPITPHLLQSDDLVEQKKR